MNKNSFSVEFLFDGNSIRQHQTVTLCDDVIESIKPWNSTGELLSGLLVPGLIDIQVNGGGGVLFNAEPNLNAIKIIAKAHNQFGTTGWLPTLVTDSFEKMEVAAEAVIQARKDPYNGVLGIHFEGPFLSSEKKGVHSARLMRQLDEKDMALFTQQGLGIVLLTVAPERVTDEQIKKLTDSGVIVSLGHSAASYEDARSALGAGATGFTHLYNAMSPLGSREPGMVGAALASSDTFSGIILDGIHVHAAAAIVAFQSKTNLVLVTDAMPLVGSDENAFDFFAQSILRNNNRLTDKDGRLAGSTLDMLSAVRNAVKMLDIELKDAVNLASNSPARFLGVEKKYGMLSEGYQASMILIDETEKLQASWCEGKKLI